jgi:hypothetical protein
MIQIGVAHYPIDLCRDIARQILELLTARNDGTGSD